MDILNKIIKDRGSLNDLFYILTLNKLSLTDVYNDKQPSVLLYPEVITEPTIFVGDVMDTTIKNVVVGAYQSILDICVQYYGGLNNIQTLLDDNELTINSYLNPGARLKVRMDDTKNKTSNTLFALNATVSNYDRVIPANQDIYLGTEDGQYIGPTTNVKIKVNR